MMDSDLKKTDGWDGLAWIFGILFVLSGFITLFAGGVLGFVGGILVIVAGLVLLPPYQRKIRSKIPSIKNRKAFAWTSLLLLVLGSTIAPRHQPESAVASNPEPVKPVQQTMPPKQSVVPTEVVPAKATQPSRNPRIAEDVYRPYDDSYKRTHKKFKGMMDEVQEYRVKAAERALASGKCSSIILSDISDEATRQNMKFFIDCRYEDRDRRIYLTKKEIDSNAPVVPVDELGLGQSEAIMACSQGIRERTRKYSDVDIHDIAGSTYSKDEKGRSKVSITFEVVNDFGAEIPFTAYCKYDADGDGRITIERGQ